jgi:putative inorganic carbon (HCO3(-)) transporter
VLVIFSVRIDVCVLFLLLIRSSLDFSTDYSLFSLAPAAKFNAAALLNLLLVFAGITYLAVNRKSISKLPGIWFLVAFLILSLAFCTRNPSIPTALADWLRNLGSLVLYVLVATTVPDKLRPGTMVKIFLLSAIVPLLVGFHQKLTGVGFFSPPAYKRIYATFFHPNPYGLYLSFIIVLTYALLHTKQRRSARVALVLLLACSGLSLLLTYSRGAWIALLVSAAVVATLTRWRSALAALGGIVLVLTFVPHILYRFEDVTGTAHQGSFWWRVQLWKKMASLVGSNALFGHGLGSFYYFSQGWAAHNDYLRLAFETGLVGLVLYLCSVLSIGFFVLRRIRGEVDPLSRVLSVAFCGLVAGFLVASAVENVVMMPVLQWYFWALAGLAVSLSTRGVTIEKSAYA